MRIARAADTSSGSAPSRKMTPADVLDVSEKSDCAAAAAPVPDGKEVVVSPNNDSPRYLVCNCDEGEPGTFKDHMLLENSRI